MKPCLRWVWSFRLLDNLPIVQQCAVGQGMVGLGGDGVREVSKILTSLCWLCFAFGEKRF